jgi:hypothetical protein
MKSVIGLLILLFSATMALADDYQIIRGTYRGSSTNPNANDYKTLVVDVTTGPYICSPERWMIKQTRCRLGAKR